MVEKGRFVVHKQDWSLDRSGPADEARHNEKVKQVIRDQLPEIISGGDIITADPQSKRIVKIPMKSLELPRFKYGRNDGGFGSGPGGEGDIIGRKPSKGGDDKDEGEAGSEPGTEYYEAEISLDELRAMVYEDLGLPYLEPKKAAQLTEEIIKFNRLLHKPRHTNIDIMRTVMQNIKRTAQETGEAKIGEFSNDDIWVRTWDVEKQRATSAVVFAIADTSGSMGEFERYVTRAFCWWMVDVLRQVYPQVEIVFVVHDTDAEEVSEQAFFTRGSSGGTICSSGNSLVRELILNRYPPALYNIYPVHFSDGDNYTSDNEKYIDVVNDLLQTGVNQYAYVQIGRQGFSNLLATLKSRISHERFHGIKIEKTAEIYPALKSILDAEKV